MKTTVDDSINFNQSQHYTLCSLLLICDPLYILTAVCNEHYYHSYFADKETMAWGDEGQGHTARSSKAKTETQTHLTPETMPLPPLCPGRKESAGFGDSCLVGVGRAEKVRTQGQLG